MNNNLGITSWDAQQKHCPIFPFETQYLFNHTLQQTTTKDVPRKCIGDACMMWTWVAGSSDRGYCGLRGHVVIP